MKICCCEKHDTEIELHRLINNDKPLIIYTQLLETESQFKIKIGMKAGDVGFCIHTLEGKSETLVPYYFDLSTRNPIQDVIPETFFIITKSGNIFTTYFCLSQPGLRVRITSSLNSESNSLFADGLVIKITQMSSLESSLASSLSLTSNLNSTLNQSQKAMSNAKKVPILISVQGSDLHQTIALTLRHALKLTGGKGRLIGDKFTLPNWMYHLGWESRAVYGKNITHDKILNAVWGLRQLGFQPGFVVIDQGWQSSETEEVGPSKSHSYASLKNENIKTKFQADPARFPEGLKGLIDELHRAGVQRVGVWHSLTNQEINAVAHDLGESFKFFHEFYGYLRDQGVVFVKVGKQNRIKNESHYHNLQMAIQAAGSIHFEIPHLNVNSLRCENIFSWTTSRLVSVCDDFDTQTIIGAKRAIRNLLMNSLWLQHLMHPDFNAWTTCQPQSDAFAVLHALSGSLNVISDPPGNHDPAILKMLVLPSGRILNADRPIELCSDSAFFDPLESPQLYKAYTFKGEHGVMALFNLFRRAKTLHGEVSASDVDGIEGKKFAVFSRYNGFLGCYKKEEKIPITLKPNQSEILTFAPVKEGIALIGCYTFYLPPAPITEISIEDESMHISSLVTAPMIMYCERQVMEIRKNGAMVPWEYDQERKVLTIDVRSTLSEIHASYTITFD